ncbi:MAG TPA: hypothetical protein VF944_02950 [Candidatus Bathyarchaeia archaeon]
MPVKRSDTAAKKRKAYYYYAGKETKAKEVAKKKGKEAREKIGAEITKALTLLGPYETRDTARIRYEV